MAEQKRTSGCGHESVEVEVANRLARVGRLFRFLDRFLKLLLKQVGSVLLRLDRLLKYGLPPAVLLAHGLGCSFHVGEGLRLDRRRMGDDGGGLSVNLQYRAATRTSHFKIGRFLGHLRESYRKIDQTGATTAPRVLAFSSAGKLKLIFTPILLSSMNLLRTYNVV